MTESSRREFLRQGGRLAAACGLATAVVPRVHAAEDNTIRLALIGCGGRGTGAAVNAIKAPGGPVKLTAMADLYQDRLDASHRILSERHSQQVDVPPERRFVGFDAYRHAIDGLRPGDIAMLTGYAAWRPLHLEYAVQKGVHVFMEKSFACDPPAARRIIAAGEAAKKKNLKIAGGLMNRHSSNRQEFIRRIRDGALGDIPLVRVCVAGGVGTRLRPRPPAERELDWQIRHFTSFFWVSGGAFAEPNIHPIDEICWIKNAWPIAAQGVGNRAATTTNCNQNLKSYAIEFTFADGTKATYFNRCKETATYIHGTKCSAQFSSNLCEGTVRLFKDQRTDRDNIVWQADKEPITPWQMEWNVLLDAIRNNRPHNEAHRSAMSNLADIMGRAAAHSKRLVTWDETMSSNFQWCPSVDAMNHETPPPVQADPQGCYPAPVTDTWSEI
ncbi:MAG: gfo/Idh/MocA family oxidoreductase [Pirellulales bacterium]|nr:gfo/Idh/MocA family oxidoreductase [Pirellulales bacterium]